MRTSLKDFTASELAAAVGIKLTRGRPSAARRAHLEELFKDARAAGAVKISKGKIVVLV